MKTATRRRTAPLTPTRPHTVTASAPVRVDLAGGWSDTPPICQDLGGCVLNVALELEARVSVAARPGLPCSPPHRLIRSILAECDGAGAVLELHSPVPQGSGLGISSILAACGVAAVRRLEGQTLTPAEIGAAVLSCERRMGTDGGWQDQWGAMVPGAKVLTTQPGPHQTPDVHPLDFDVAGFEARLILAYTGQQRLAADVLHQVVSRYREGTLTERLRRMKVTAWDTAHALLKSDWETLGTCLNQAWTDNRRLHASVSNGRIDALMELLAPHVHGAKLCGAGGGGFLVALARDREAAERVLQANACTLYPCRVATRGLEVTTDA